MSKPTPRGSRRKTRPRGPFYEVGGSTIYAGDCLEVMERLPAASVDMVFADPPYNLSNGGFSCHAGRMVPVHKGDWDKSKGLETDLIFTTEWLRRCQRLLKPSGSIWISGTQHVIFVVGFALQKLGFHLLNTITWYKPNAPPNLSCRFFTHSNELLIWASPQGGRSRKHVFNYEEMRRRNGDRQMRDVWQLGAPVPDEKKFGKHPTQKPLALLNRIIAASTNPEDLVLDPFCGSGTTGVMAVALRRRFIGIEMDTNHLKTTVRRLEEAAGDRGDELMNAYRSADTPDLTLPLAASR